MSCPRRAVVGQWTRRSDSPCAYSRTEWKSKPAGRRSSRRRPSLPRRPASLKSARARRGAGRRRAPRRPRRRELDRLEAEVVAERERRLGDRVPAARQPAEVERGRRVRVRGPRSRHSNGPSRPSGAAHDDRGGRDARGARGVDAGAARDRPRSPAPARGSERDGRRPANEPGPDARGDARRASSPTPATPSGREPKRQGRGGDAAAPSRSAPPRASCRYRRPLEGLPDDVRAGDTRRARLRRDDQPVLEHGHGDRLRRPRAAT